MVLRVCFLCGGKGGQSFERAENLEGNTNGVDFFRKAKEDLYIVVKEGVSCVAGRLGEILRGRLWKSWVT